MNFGRPTQSIAIYTAMAVVLTVVIGAALELATMPSDKVPGIALALPHLTKI
jgi:hypothetical protein